MIILPFVIIRKYSGGYHTKKAWVCLISSSLLLILCIGLSYCINCNWFLIIIMGLSAVSLVFFSPIENENRLLSKEEHICYKKIVAVIVVMFIVVDLLLFWFRLYTCVICVSIGLILSASLQLPCILRKLLIKWNDQNKQNNVVWCKLYWNICGIDYSKNVINFTVSALSLVFL